MGVVLVRVFLVGAILGACTSRNPNACDTDADCKDPTKPFCDIKGEYVESHYTANSCSAIPANCPVDRCGCVAGTALSCASDQSTVCGTDGKSTVTVACPLGCSPTGPQCATFDPSNGLGPALADAANEPDVLFPSMAHVDTDLGVVQDASNVAVTVKSALVAQPSGPMIRVFEAKSFVMDAVVVTGSYPVAFVAPGTITIRGAFDASGTGIQPGPGAQAAAATCAGMNSTETCNGTCSARGAGGGGNATAGGRGGYFGSPGGLAQTAFAPLAGGCPGGDTMNGTTVVLPGGGGGGGIEFVSLTQVALTMNGVVNVGGGGGARGGGGSGGNVIIEAPSVRIDGPLAGIAANGGAGGGCFMNGPDGTPDSSVAYGPRCSPNSAGDGGTGTTSATNGEDCTGACVLTLFGAGGGAVGRARIATKDGTFAETNNPIFSVVVSPDVLSVH